MNCFKKLHVLAARVLLPVFVRVYFTPNKNIFKQGARAIGCFKRKVQLDIRIWYQCLNGILGDYISQFLGRLCSVYTWPRKHLILKLENLLWCSERSTTSRLHYLLRSSKQEISLILAYFQRCRCQFHGVDAETVFENLGSKKRRKWNCIIGRLIFHSSVPNRSIDIVMLVYK